MEIWVFNVNVKIVPVPQKLQFYKNYKNYNFEQKNALAHSTTHFFAKTIQISVIYHQFSFHINFPKKIYHSFGYLQQFFQPNKAISFQFRYKKALCGAKENLL